jgi:hypothetical protein
MADAKRQLSRAMNPAATDRKPPPALADGRWFFVAVGLTTALIGAVFVWLMARSYLRAREMHAWPEVPCVILSAEIEERIHDPQSPREYRFAPCFGYEWQGRLRTGDHLTPRGSPWSSKRAVVAKRAAEYPPGMRTTCRVDPRDPDFAVLKPDSLAPGYSIWFPALFVIGGLGIAMRAAVGGARTSCVFRGTPAEDGLKSGVGTE